MLKGNKTYIVAILIAVATGVKYLGYIDESMYQTLVAILGATGLGTLRSSVAGVDKKLLIILPLFLLFPNSAYSQTVSTGPVTTSMKLFWEVPANVTLTENLTFEIRLRDTLVPTVFTVVVAPTCTAGTPNVCISQLTAKNVTDLNKLGAHKLSLTYFRADVGESQESLPFSLLSPPLAPTGLLITK